MIIWKSVTFGIDEEYFENSRMIHLRIALISNDYPQIKSLRINLHVTILNELKIQANQKEIVFPRVSVFDLQYLKSFQRFSFDFGW